MIRIRYLKQGIRQVIKERCRSIKNIFGISAVFIITSLMVAMTIAMPVMATMQTLTTTVTSTITSDYYRPTAVIGSSGTWSSTGNVYDTNDSNYATISIATGTTKYISYGTFDFSSIPLNAVINGVEVTSACSYATQVYNSFYILGASEQLLGSTGTYGSSTNNFGMDLEDLKSSNFGFKVEVNNNSGSTAYVQLYYIKMKVYYTYNDELEYLYSETTSTVTTTETLPAETSTVTTTETLPAVTTTITTTETLPAVTSTVTTTETLPAVTSTVTTTETLPTVTQTVTETETLPAVTQTVTETETLPAITVTETKTTALNTITETEITTIAETTETTTRTVIEQVDTQSMIDSWLLIAYIAVMLVMTVMTVFYRNMAIRLVVIAMTFGLIFMTTFVWLQVGAGLIICWQIIELLKDM